jgi:molecular chaperone DnaJ
MSDPGSDGGIRSDWATKDFYAVLGVGKTASADEIKKAYRKLARANHPDSHPDDSAKHEKFKQVAEAYDVIGDPEKRKKYDQARQLFASGGFPAGGSGSSGSTINLEDLLRERAGGGGGFGDLFGDFLGFGAGSGGGASGGGRRSQPRPARGADLETTTTIGFADALEGITVSLRIASDSACPTCSGTGGKPGTSPHRCPTCDGSGFVVASVGGAFSMNETCPGCGGRQLVYDEACPTCHGSGRGRSARTIQAKVPAGVKDGQRIRLRGKGAPGERGGPAGDLFVTVKVSPHRVFGRKGDHLTIDVPISFAEAALGAAVKVPTLGGPPVTLKIPPGTPNGRTFRVRGKGAPRPDGTHGDLLATVEVQVPAHLGDEAREALEAYAAATADTKLRAGLFERTEQ